MSRSLCFRSHPSIATGKWPLETVCQIPECSNHGYRSVVIMSERERTYFSPLLIILMNLRIWSWRHPMPIKPVSSKLRNEWPPRISSAAVCDALQGSCMIKKKDVNISDSHNMTPTTYNQFSTSFFHRLFSHLFLPPLNLIRSKEEGRC